MSNENKELTIDNSIKNKHAVWQIPLCIAGVAALAGVVIYGAGISAATALNPVNNTVVQTEKASVNASADNYIESLGQYKGLTTQAVLQKATDEDIDVEIKELVKQAEYTSPVTDRAAQAGDIVTIDYIQDSDENAEPSNLHFEIGDSNYPATFSDAIIGHKPGEEVKADLDDGNGNTNSFKITISAIEAYRDADDDFAKGLNIDGVTSLDTLKDWARTQLDMQYQAIYNEQARTDFIKQLHDTTTFKEIPSDILDPKVEELKKQLEQMAKEYSTEEETVTINDIVMPTMQQEGYVGTVDDYLVYYVSNILQNTSMFRGIYEAENLEYSQAELYSLIASDWVNAQQTYPTLLSYVDSTDITTYEDQLINTKAMDFIAENSNSDYKVQ